MTSDIDLTMALGDLPRTRPIIDGDVTFEGINPKVLTMHPRERHSPMLQSTEFDVCELSLGSYLASIPHDDIPFHAIPVFPSRQFRHRHAFVNSRSDIESPGDLEGARVGLRSWQNTAALWMRGILAEQHGVDPTAIDWHVNKPDVIPNDLTPEIRVHRTPQDQDLDDLLEAGDIDALLYTRNARGYEEGHPDVKRLFPDYLERSERYFQDTGIHPLMHTIVIADRVTDDHPWVPQQLIQGFETANRYAIDEFETLLTERRALSWAIPDPAQVLEIERALWTDDIADLESSIGTLIRYGHQFGIIDEPTEPADLFRTITPS